MVGSGGVEPLVSHELCLKTPGLQSGEFTEPLRMAESLRLELRRDCEVSGKVATCCR